MSGTETGTSARSAGVLRELRAYRTAEEAMRRRTREAMNMGENDLTALRFLLRAQREKRVVTPGALADHLGMRSASVTVMLDRLTKSGHVARRPHPTDRRSLAVVATADSDDEVRATLGAMHSRMMKAVSGLDAHDAEIVRDFLLALADAADRAGT